MLRLGLDALAPQSGISKLQPCRKICPHLLHHFRYSSMQTGLDDEHLLYLDTHKLRLPGGVARCVRRRLLAHKVAMTR
jgi:hypothetical protein